MAEPTTFTGYEPKHLAEHQDLAEHEDLRVKTLFFHRPSIASTCDSAESIATSPPESDLDDEQIRALLASPLYLQVTGPWPMVCGSLGLPKVAPHFSQKMEKLFFC